MDFHNLLKQAKANQESNIKKFDEKQQQKVTEQAHARTLENAKKAKLNKKLKHYEADLNHSRLSYKGLVTKSGERVKGTFQTSHSSTSSSDTQTSRPKTSALGKPASKSLPSTTKKPSSNGQKQTIAKKDKLVAVRTSTSKSLSPRPSQKSSKKIAPAAASSLKSKTPPPKLSSSKKAPPKAPPKVNFEDLIKMAKNNSIQSRPNIDGGSSRPVSGGVASGLGRALMDKERRDDTVRSKSMQAPPTKRALIRPSSSSNSTTGTNKRPHPYKTELNPSKHQNKTGERRNPYESEGMKPANTGEAGTRRHLKNPYNTDEAKTQRLKNSDARGAGETTKKPGTPTTKRRLVNPYDTGAGAANPHTVTSSGRGRGGRGSQMKSVKAGSFYKPASARLVTDRSGSHHGLVDYRSSWVDEMSEYLHQENYDLDDEEEDDLEGFVVDEADDYCDDYYDNDGEEDYSSAIREIFGYNKNRYQDNYNDDEVMESSYAQQMFEEQRSAHIGRMEDEEEFKREQQRQRKRKAAPNKKELSSSKKFKQPKLTFS